MKTLIAILLILAYLIVGTITSIIIKKLIPTFDYIDITFVGLACPIVIIICIAYLFFGFMPKLIIEYFEKKKK